MKILVTGGAGFIGSHVCDSLVAQGHKIVIVDKLSNQTTQPIDHLRNHPQVTIHLSDILYQPLMDRIFEEGRFDVVFHLAANADIRISSQHINVDLSDTLMTTIVILRLMQKHGVPALLFSSSSAVYGDSTESAHEYSQLKPISYYGAAKLASEAFIRAAVEMQQLSKALMFRFSNVIGERLTHGVILDIHKNLITDPTKIVLLGNGEQDKPYIYVQDVVDAMMFAWNHHRIGNIGVYNIGVENTTKVKDIIRMYLEESGLTPEIYYKGGNRGWLGDVPILHMDCSRLEQLGWKATMPSDEAVRKTIKAIL